MDLAKLSWVIRLRLVVFHPPFELGVLVLLSDLELTICDAIRGAGGRVGRVWVVPPHGVTFIVTTKPRLVSSMRGVLSSWHVLVRLSSLSNDDVPVLDEPFDCFFAFDPLVVQQVAIDELAQTFREMRCDRIDL